MQNVQTDYLPIIADVSAPLLTAAAHSQCPVLAANTATHEGTRSLEPEKYFTGPKNIYLPFPLHQQSADD